MTDFIKINEEQKSTNTEYYTQTRDEDGTKKLVLKAAPSMDKEALKTKLEQKTGQQIKIVIPLKK